MPHECTNCRRTFADGSKEMLSGCPECGGNKFRYRPTGHQADTDTDTDPEAADSVPDDAGPKPNLDQDPGPDHDPADAPEPGRPDRGGVTDTVSRATRNLKEWVGVDDDTSHNRPIDGDRDHPDPAADPDPTRDPMGGSATTPATDSNDPDEGPGPEQTTFDDQFGRPPATSSSSSSDHDRHSDRDQERDSDRTSAPSTAETAGPGSGPRPDQAPSPSAEDAAQASARTSMVGPDDLPGSAVWSDSTTTTGTPTATDTNPDGGRASESPQEPTEPAPTDTPPDQPDLSELREELNDQFESIKIVEPGQYELNLMELYDRDEYIISLMEDGRYAIEVPESWRDPNK